MFSRVAVIGLGLIGGSLALDLKRLKLTDHILGYDADEERGKRVAMQGLADEVFDDWNDELFNAELLVLAVPVGQVPSVIEKCQQWLNPPCNRDGRGKREKTHSCHDAKLSQHQFCGRTSDCRFRKFWTGKRKNGFI